MTDHLLAALTDKPATVAAMFAGVVGCLLVIAGVIGLYWGKS